MHNFYVSNYYIFHFIVITLVFYAVLILNARIHFFQFDLFVCVYLVEADHLLLFLFCFISIQYVCTRCRFGVGPDDCKQFICSPIFLLSDRRLRVRVQYNKFTKLSNFLFGMYAVSFCVCESVYVLFLLLFLLSALSLHTDMDRMKTLIIWLY